MPKRHSRPDLVRKLVGAWQNYYKRNTYLKSVSVCNGMPLRGITDSTLEFSFPVTVITGANGTGKTTFLALSVLGFHAASAPLVPLRNTHYFDFNYFFRSAAKDRHDQGIELRWDYTNGESDTTKKGKQRWMRYIRNNGQARRPVRGTEFIGISRITPAFEKKNYHSYFSGKHRFKSRVHEPEVIGYFSRIMSRPYSVLSELSYGNSSGSHVLHRYNDLHTSFNAGAGEECLSTILNTLVSCPEGAIIAIEEVEIGLHPSTLPRLLDVILEVALKRKLQVIITSHSPDFLRSCPKEALVLAQRNNNVVEFINQPNIEYAINRIGGTSQHSACIICEDEVASSLIQHALPNKIRNICPVIAFGGKSELLDKAKTIRSFNHTAKIVVVWDGEVSSSVIEDAEKEGFIATQLPGGIEPEAYITEKLKTSIGKVFLEKHYNLEKSEISSLLDELEACEDAHDIPYVIDNHIGLSDSANSARDTIINFISTEFKDEFSDMVLKIGKALQS